MPLVRGCAGLGVLPTASCYQIRFGCCDGETAGGIAWVSLIRYTMGLFGIAVAERPRVRLFVSLDEDSELVTARSWLDSRRAVPGGLIVRVDKLLKENASKALQLGWRLSQWALRTGTNRSPSARLGVAIPICNPFHNPGGLSSFICLAEPLRMAGHAHSFPFLFSPYRFGCQCDYLRINGLDLRIVADRIDVKHATRLELLRA